MNAFDIIRRPTVFVYGLFYLLAVCLVLSLLFQSILVSSAMGGISLPSATILGTPLAYYGPKDRSCLADEVREGLSRRLESHGYTVLLSKDGPPRSLDDVIKAGKTQQVQFVFYGSISCLGEWLGLNLRLLDLKDAGREPRILFTKGERREMGMLLDQMEAEMVKVLAAPYLVAEVCTSGNRRVDTDAILQATVTRAGDFFDPEIIASDIKSIYKMGYFNDVQVDASESPSGRVVTFILKEKPAIKKIKFSGNKEISEEKIRGVIDLKPYTIIQEKTLQENAEKIKALYMEKGYIGTNILASVEQVSGQVADVIFEITEGEQVRVKAIEFQGNHTFSDKELKKLLETSEKKPLWIPSWSNIVALFKGEQAVLKQDALERDLGRIAAYYHNRGYVDAKVGQPMVQRKDAWLYITIPIDEGSLYGVGQVDIEEDFFKDKERLLSELKITQEPVFSRQILRQDILKLTDLYADEGFAYADISPRIEKDPKKKLVNITLLVNTGPSVKFERIEIVGNTRTRDKVIRRELRVKELEPFSASGFRRSSQRLKRLGYFKDVNLTPSKGSSEEYMHLKVEVEEQPTGTFSIGAGYSSVENLMFMGEISQRNFLGKGQSLSFRGILGSKTNRYSLNFVEPYFMDTRLLLGIELYNWEYEYNDYAKESTGGAVRFGYPLTDDISTFIKLRMDDTDISDYSSNASTIIEDSLDIHTTRSVSIGLSQDTRDDYYNPAHGWYNKASVEYAGGLLGGDSAFVKLEGRASYYHPIWKAIIGHVNGGIGYVTEGSSGKLPIYEKFFLGGMDSVRGFKYGDVSPIDPETGDRIGGEYMGFMQLETIFPLLKNMGLNGVCFLDMGNVWEKDSAYDLGDLRKSVGLGVRWLSPMGPLSIEWGYNIDKEEGDDTSNWEFRMGGSF
ncbi:MAG: outer membrane protein assembly factor BamA [Deltaproteobacteria bacterium]|nr:outer membrane protein assembly factor BamA [Deltaproteobacteria bacterium]MDL1960882.1 outer membrane protein assembly factor BamA [Deltaproteobacteria bacterium]